MAKYHNMRLSLYKEDAERIRLLQPILERKMGMTKLSQADVIRVAIKELAEKEFAFYTPQTIQNL